MEPTPHHRFATLVEPHLPELRAFVDRRAPALADDVLSEVGVVAWRRIDELPPGKERAWLFGVTRNVLMAEHRKVAARDSGRADVELADLASPADLALTPAVHGPLAQALARLSARDRELLLLTAWEGLSTAEAAAVLDIRGTAARMGLVRARRRLAAALDELDPGWTGQPATVARPSRSHAANPSTPVDPTEEVSRCAAAER